MKEVLLKVIEMLKALVFSMEEPIEKLPVSKNKNKLNRNRNMLYYASKELGVKEVQGKKDNPRVRLYHAYSTKDNKKGMADSVPWCASFICFLTEMSGMTSTNSKMARSFEKWGVSSRKSPLPGDIVTFYRNGRKSGQGHVGMFLKMSGSYVYVLGGNQSDEVNITRYSTDRMTDIRRSSRAKYTAMEVLDLVSLGANLMDGKKISKGGKVT